MFEITPEKPVEGNKNLWFVAFLAIGCLYLFARFWNLTASCLVFDEIFSVHASSLSERVIQIYRARFNSSAFFLHSFKDLDFARRRIAFMAQIVSGFLVGFGNCAFFAVLPRVKTRKSGNASCIYFRCR